MGRQSKQRKINPVTSTKIVTKIKKRLNPIISCQLIQVSLRFKPSKKTKIIKTAKRAIKLIDLMPLRLQKKTRIKLKT